MAVRFEGWQGRIATLRIEGILHIADAGAVGSVWAAPGAPPPPAHVLCLLDGFQGWEKGDWDAPAVQKQAFANEERITRLAIVGDPKWEDDALLFAGVPFTSKKVRFFPPAAEAAARAWLEEG